MTLCSEKENRPIVGPQPSVSFKMAEHNVEIKDILQETHEVRTFRLDKPAGFSFIPGQYCMMSLDSVPGISRPFTFTSIPSDPYIDLTIKLMKHFTKMLFELKPGDHLTLKGPYGKALNIEPGRQTAYIAGGSGITPFMSHIREKIREGDISRNYLFYSNRTEEDIIFKEELVSVDKRPNFTIINMLSRDSNKKGYESGHITRTMIDKYINDPKSYKWYVCGPPAMNESMLEMLQNIGVAKESVSHESWEIPGKEG